MVRALHEFVASLRRAGVRVSSAEVLDGVRAAVAVGVASRCDLRSALVTTLAKTARDRAVVERTFEQHFGEHGAPAADLYARLRHAGFADSELEALRALLDVRLRSGPAASVLSALVGGEPAVEQLLYTAGRSLTFDRAGDPARAGFLTMRLLEAARVPRAETELEGLRLLLRGALGERGNQLADFLAQDLSSLRLTARRYVTQQLTGEKGPLEERPFHALTSEEIAHVERLVKQLAERLLGRAAVQRRHRRRGRLDPHRTMRRALRTLGVPMAPRFRSRARRRPKLLLLCDVSESMHASARFMLLFVHTVQRLFHDARSFVFVSDLREATAVFRREPAARAIELAYRGAIVSVADNSHYARAFDVMLREHRNALSAQTTLLVLGDGRTNHFSSGASTFEALSARVRRVLWLTPEPESAWGARDSALPEYRPAIAQLLPVYDLQSLRAAARAIVRG